MKKYKHRTSFLYDGKRYYVNADSLEELYSKKANMLRDLEDGKVELSKNTTVSQWAEESIKTYKHNASEQVISAMYSRLKKYINPVIGNMKISSVKPVQCQNVLNSCEGMSFSQVNKLFQELKFYFRTARYNQLIIQDPTEFLQMPSSIKRSRRSITDTERKHLLEVCEDDHFILFLLMLYCGCRPSEARNCIGKDIEVREGVRVLHIRGTKTVNSDRYVPIPDVLYNRVKDTPPFREIAVNECGRAFSTTGYNRLVSSLRRQLNLSMGCKTYRNQLIPPYPLADDFVPYCLRHTYCTDLAKKGIDIRTAQRLMGHASISMTADIYTHVDTSFLKDAALLLSGNE